jgi:(1->4)-alpha-D-glucan 1-alpha-D-glucosylmutase
VLKLASPGIPDFYQGTELWDLNLVDPDNRRPVDFDRRRELLEGLQQMLGGREGESTSHGEHLARLAAMLDSWQDGRIKMWVTMAGLRLRRDNPALFLEGEYLALETDGSRRTQVFAFARSHGGKTLIAAIPRFVSRMGEGWRDWAGNWGDTVVRLPRQLAGRQWRNVLTFETHDAEAERLEAASIFRNCPVALLISGG